VPPATILPDPACLHLLGLTADAASITATVRTTATTAPCPLCSQPATQVHSRYTRHLADLPWHGVAMRLVLHVRKCFCQTPACPRRVFTERLPGVVAPYARRTLRLADWFVGVGFAAGGMAGARVLQALGLSATPALVLARLRAYRAPAGPTPRVLGVDDFALRRRGRYGTILVDLERHRPVDLLPDRTAQTLASWLKAHPGVAIITRDRGGDYAVGAREGAPDALQVADRFHLVKNLSELVERVLRRHAPALQQLLTAPSSAAAAGPATVPPRPEREVARAQVHAQIRHRYEAMHALAAQGLSRQAIADALGLNRQTVVRNLRLPTCPQRARHPRRANILDPYEPYLRARWQQGERNGLGLWREILARGSPGTSRNVSRLLTYWRQQEQEARPSPVATEPDGPGVAAADVPAAPDGTSGPGGMAQTESSPRRGMTPREAVGLLFRPVDDLTCEQRATRAEICQLDPEIVRVDGLCTRFRQLFRDRDVIGLDSWLAEADQSGIEEVTRFAARLRKDLAAVEAAVTSPWSQGQVEGQVNRLKLVKRSMYGRAKFDLLRQRVLYHAAA
jgi:transposase